MTPISTNFLQTLGNSFIWFSPAFILFWCSWMFVKSKTARTSPSPPGPRGIPLLGSIPFLDPDLHTYFADMARTYGPIFKLRLGLKVGIVITSPDLAREVLKDHDITFANRDVPATGRAATYGGSDIVWTPYGAEWRMLRKVCVIKMLSNTTLDSVYTLRRREVRETTRYIYSRAGSEINIGEQMFLTVWNVITSMLWGGTVEGKEREEVSGEFREVVSEMTGLLGQPNVSDFFSGLGRFDLQGLEKRMYGCAKQFDGIFEMLINQRLRIEREGGSKADDKDFLQFLLRLKDDGDAKPPLSTTHIKALLMDMIVGGTETSSNTVEFAMAEIINKPEILRKAQQELDTVVGRENTVEESHIHNLPYLLAIMKETLRLHPTLPLLVPHSPSQTCTVGGYTIPTGSRVFVNVWAIQRDPSIWENPLEFKPERFLNEKWDFSGKDFNYFPFGSGRRICAGIAMAERMVLYSLATLLHSFDWKLPDGQQSADLTEKFGIVMKLKTPLALIPTPRLSVDALYQQ